MEMLKILSRVPCNAICHLVGNVQHEEKKENSGIVANKNEKKGYPSNEKKKILSIKRGKVYQGEKRNLTTK